MMNDFGTPMSDVEINMKPPGAIKPHEQMMAASGIENDWGWLVPAVLGGIGMWQDNKNRNKAADHSEEAAKRQLAYDTEGWESRWEKLNLDRAHLLEGIKIKADNEERLAAYRDATNDQQYKMALAIRHREQTNIKNQLAKSQELFDKTVTQNAKVAEAATESEWRKLDETHAEASFTQQEQRLEYLQQEGSIRAKGASGRSAGKVQQSAMASYGQQVAMLNEGIASAGRNTKAMIEQIKDDQYSADLAAWAAKMLDPGDLPMPIKPLKTPRAVFQDPRELDPIVDKGPAPVLGAYTSNYAGSSWTTGLSSIASGLSGGYDPGIKGISAQGWGFGTG